MAKKSFAAFDIDGTIFRSSLLIEVVEQCIIKGVFSRDVQALYEQQRHNWLNRKDPDAYDTYILKVVEAFDQYIKGVTQTQFRLVAESVIEQLHARTYVYTTKLIEELREQGKFLIAISGSPEELVKLFAQKYRFDYYYATQYHAQDGVYDGTARRAHRDKDVILKNLIDELNLDSKDSYAIGDSGGDKGLLTQVEHPIAFNPDRKLFDLAKANDWKVVVERKNVIYELEPSSGDFVLAKAN